MDEAIKLDNKVTRNKTLDNLNKKLDTLVQRRDK